MLLNTRAYYCEKCGTPMQQVIPPRENALRDVCPNCGYIRYFNPIPVVGTIATYEDKVLLARRAIEPRYGYWTLPGGFMEINETLANGAVRETIEETNAKVAIIDLFTVFDSCSSNNISFFYRARLDSPEFSATSESLEVRLFAEEEIPWEQLSFQTVRLTLQAFFDDRKKGSFTVHRFSI